MPFGYVSKARYDRDIEALEDALVDRNKELQRVLGEKRRIGALADELLAERDAALTKIARMTGNLKQYRKPVEQAA